jgi:hypothetical protein
MSELKHTVQVRCDYCQELTDYPMAEVLNTELQRRETHGSYGYVCDGCEPLLDADAAELDS